MPKRIQVTEQTYTREEAEAYHRLMLEMVEEVVKWVHLGEILKEEPLKMPGALESFEMYIREIQKAASTLPMQGNDLSESEMRELFIRMCESESRCREYYKMVNARVQYKKKAPKLLSIVELEERYQHRLYKRARVTAGLDVGSRFEKWRMTEDCHVFYDDMC